jgi:hypothetical protein
MLGIAAGGFMASQREEREGDEAKAEEAVSWRWVIDRRGGRTRVDWPVLGGTLGAAVVISLVLRVLFPGAWYYLAAILFAAIAIAADVLIRRRHPEDRTSEPD